MEIASLSRRERERLARRQAMLDAALAVFAEKGYEGATLDEVAERAEFGKGTLYNYFPNGKTEILFALLDGVYDGLVAIIETYFTEETEQRPARPLFRDFIAALIAYFSEHQAVFMILAKDAPRLMLDADTAARFFAQRERVAEAVTGPIHAAMERGDLRPLDPHGVAHMLMGNIHGYMMHAFVACRAGHAPATLDSAQGADLLTSILFDGLLSDRARA